MPESQKQGPLVNRDSYTATRLPHVLQRVGMWIRGFHILVGAGRKDLKDIETSPSLMLNKDFLSFTS